ncbi:hypothetical protein ACFL4B_01975 [Candidatus Neomarinimicrobiota bacterium]
MRFSEKINRSALIYILLCFPSFPLLADISASEELINLEKKVRSESIALNSLIKNVYPNYTENLESVRISKLKIVSNQCRVRETIERSSQSLYSPTINEEFKIIGSDDNYIHIDLGDGRDGWIHETCGQTVTETVEKKSVGSKLSDSDIGKYLDFSEEIYNKIVDNKLLAERLVKTNSIDKNNKSYKKIQKYHSLAVGIYNKYLKDRESYIIDNYPFEKRISGSTEFLAGKASHNQKFLDGTVTEFEEGNRDFAITGDYIVGKSSRVNLIFNSNSKVLQTPYKTKNYGIGFNYSGLDKLLLNTSINFNSYDDALTENNDYGRFLFNTNATHQLSQKANLRYNYSFLKNNYKIDDGNDFSNQKLSAIANLKLNEISKLVLSMLANFENSDSEYHNFSGLFPSISLQKKVGEKRTDLKFQFDNLKFEDLELRDYSRMTLSYLINNRKINKRKTTNLSASSKSFPNNDISNYFQVKGRFASSIIGEKNKRNSLSIYTNVYPNATDNSFTDFRIDHNVVSSMFYNVSAYYRLWHNMFSSDNDSTSSKNPSIIDLSGKFGFKVGPIKVGPTIGLHAILDFDEDEVFKRDGNLFRLGGVAEGNILLPKMVNIALMAAYDYGTVYNEELTVASSTGEITLGELQERHPTTMQFSTTISAPLIHNLELIGRINYYKINTDLDETLSINPIKFTKQMSFQFGIRYRYN